MNALRSLATACYRRLARPAGRNRLRQMIEREELPPVLHAPLRFLVNPADRACDPDVIQRIEDLRSELACRTGNYQVAEDPSVFTSARIVRPAATGLPAAWLAHVASVPEYWGTFLHLCACAAGAERILELGSCAGISGCYLASAPRCRKLITVDGSPEMAAIAAGNLARIAPHAEVVHALFDQALDRILPESGPGFDLVYLDGHHDRDPTLHYFDRIRHHLRCPSLLIFDDIYLYRGMQEVWNILRAREGVRAAVNTGRFGVCLWDGTSRQPAYFDLSRYTGWWRIGQARRKR